MKTPAPKVETPQKPSASYEYRAAPKSSPPYSTGQPIAQLADLINQSPLVQRQLQLREDINNDWSRSAEKLPVNVSIEAEASENSPADSSVVQRAKADVSYQIADGSVNTVGGKAVGKGGKGGESHSEQHIWDTLKGTLLDALTKGKTVKVNFIVDTTICSLCTPWFEGTVWDALHTAAEKGEAEFELKVTVNGRSVIVNGENTIWPPEIADAPTFERLTDYERFEKFFIDRRNEKGRLTGEDFSTHVNTQGRGLLDVIRDYGYRLSGSDIQDALSAGRDKAIEGQAVQYNLTDEEENDEEATKTAMHEGMDGIGIYEIVTSGRFNTPKLELKGNHETVFKQWLTELEAVFQSWLEEFIQDEYEAHRVRTPY